MSSEVSLLIELYNPLYLFPIVAVVFTALMVYAFGFKSSTQPPTEVVDALNDKHHKNVKTSHETVKRRKPTQKVSSSVPKSDPKTQHNGHITSESNRATEKTPKKVAPEPTAKTSGKNKKNKKNDQIDVEVEDKNSGEWVEIISNKERKSRKQKEEQLLTSSLTVAKNEKNKEAKTKSKPASPKKSKPAKNEVFNGDDNSSAKKSKETFEEVAKPTSEPISSKYHSNSVDHAEEIVADRDVPDVYGLAKEQRAPKKTQKQKNNTKRNSESEPNSKAESSPEKEPKPNINLSDKLTAAIVANYEANDKKADNASNKKKKKKTSDAINANVNGKQTLLPHRNEENNTANGLVIESSKPDIPTATEATPPEEEEFKQVVNKKRRARRE